MYLFYRCPSVDCDFDVHVSGSPKEIELLIRQSHVCPYCGTTLGYSSSFLGDKKAPPRKLGFKEFYGAVNGMGLPEETVTHMEPVVAMLKACKIVDVDADEVNGRCILNMITLDNGVVLHLAASGYGAAVFKATRRGNHASFGTKLTLDEQRVRGRKLAEKHCPRGCGDTGHGSEVHRRLREDADASRCDGGGTAVPPAGGGEQQGKGVPEVVRHADDGEAERTCCAEEKGPEEGQEGCSG